MLDHDTLFPDHLPEAFEDAYHAISGAFEKPEDLLQADVGLFERLDCCAFAYFDRDDVFYVNPVGRALLEPLAPSFGHPTLHATPIFWLEDHEAFTAADHQVLTARRPLFEVRELVTFSWGKSWMEGAKFPILSRQGYPLAILFAGHEISPAAQIRRVADHYQRTLQGTGVN